MISIITDSGVGGTFLAWTLHYLSGHTDYYSVDQQKFIPLVDNPTTQHNAHLFKANHPFTKKQFEHTFEHLINQPCETFHTLYFHRLVNKNTAQFDTDTAECISQLCQNSSKILLVTLSSQNVLYYCSYNARADKSPAWGKPEDQWVSGDERFQDFIDYFFGDVQTQWGNDTPITSWNTWDKREFLALNLRPFDFKSILDHVDTSVEHYTLDTMELWNRFDTGVVDLFEYLELPLNQDRYARWLNVYSQWKKVHQNRLMFVWYFDTIISYIIDGRELDLQKFNLDLSQEAAIQHTLIYKHGLNLKNWQLEKFVSTQQLHNLLEKNTHSLSS